MKKGNVCMLVVDDADMNCDSASSDLSKMSVSNVGFSPSILETYQFIIYKGDKGCKILKSTLGVPTGNVVER